MSAHFIVSLSVWVVGVWGALVAAYALYEARRPRWEPAQPEEPEHHH